MTDLFIHYKNKPYRYLGEVVHSESLETLVLYETRYENSLGKCWVRPKEMFFSEVEIGGEKRPRFAKVDFQYNTWDFVDAKRAAILQSFFAEIFPDFSASEFAEKLAGQERHFAFSAWHGERLVGVKLGYIKDKNIFHSRMGGVAPDYRGVGLGQALIDQMIAWCQKSGIKKITTNTYNHFPQMLRLNIQNGFAIYAASPNADGQIKLFLEKEI